MNFQDFTNSKMSLRNAISLKFIFTFSISHVGVVNSIFLIDDSLRI